MHKATLVSVYLSVLFAGKLMAADLSSHITVNTLIGPMRHVVRYAPSPEVPRELAAQCTAGPGSFAIDLNVISGLPDDVRVVKSTGCPAIDQIVITTLRKRAFVPHALRKVIVPVNLSSTTAQQTSGTRRASH